MIVTAVFYRIVLRLNISNLEFYRLPIFESESIAAFIPAIQRSLPDTCGNEEVVREQRIRSSTPVSIFLLIFHLRFECIRYSICLQEISVNCD